MTGGRECFWEVLRECEETQQQSHEGSGTTFVYKKYLAPLQRYGDEPSMEWKICLVYQKVCTECIVHVYRSKFVNRQNM